ncbi:MAG: hypothetical protein AB1733_16720, partial [Thermodesulfobacteriota bacterium]
VLLFDAQNHRTRLALSPGPDLLRLVTTTSLYLTTGFSSLFIAGHRAERLTQPVVYWILTRALIARRRRP